MKTPSTLLLLLNLVIYILVAKCAQTGPPGQCTKGQGDDRTHPSSEYTPVIYNFNPAATKPTKATSPLVFMSWNIQSDYNFTCGLALSDQTALMAKINPDFLGLQETDINVDIRCNCNQPQSVANALGHVAYFLQVFPFRSGKYGTTTSFGYTALNTQYIYYNVSSTFEQRGAIGHLVSPPQLNGQQMWYVNTHLEQSSSDARMLQVQQLINWVKNTLLAKQPNAVVVMTGDYYTVPGDGTYETMANYFSNAWAVFHGSTANGYTHPSDGPNQRFDHIWFRDPAAGNIHTTVKDFTIYTSLLSDHLPIYASLTFTTGPVTTGSPTPAPTSAPVTMAPTQAPTCSDAQRGQYRCVSDQGFQQCDHNMWTKTLYCPKNTVCVQYGTSIYCGYLPQ